MRALWSLVGLTLVASLACGGEPQTPAPIPQPLVPYVGPLDDNFERYRDHAGYRRAILMRDLVAGDNRYGEERRAFYGIPDAAWDALPERDWLSRPATRRDVDDIQAQRPLVFDDVTRLVPAETPVDDAAWIALGRRVFFEFPLHASPIYEAVAKLDRLDDVGFIAEPATTPERESYIGLRAFVDDDDPTETVRLGPTCAQCHASRDEAGVVTGQRANRAMDIGRARILAAGLEPGNLPPELDSTRTADFDRLGPGRADVLGDGVFNPYAFPYFGALRDLPFLHHNANWTNTQVATLAVRCETLFITSGLSTSRPPRVLTWALAKYIRSLAPSAPLDATPAQNAARGEEVFAEQGCIACHVPPLYTSDRRVPVDEVGTDASAALSDVRASGGYRIPSLRGIGRLAPYLHHGVFDSLEEMFDSARLNAPRPEDDGRYGHPFGLTASDDDIAALLAFLRSI